MIRAGSAIVSRRRALLGEALAINPHFSILHAADAVRALGSRMRRGIAAVLSRRVIAMLLPAVAAAAHPLGNFTVNRYSGHRGAARRRIRVDYVVDMAEIPTFQVLPAIDTDGDGTASATELGAWAARRAPALAAGLDVTLDRRTSPTSGRRGRPAAGRAGRPADPPVRGHVREQAPTGRARYRTATPRAGSAGGRSRPPAQEGEILAGSRSRPERQQRATFISARPALEPARRHVDDRRFGPGRGPGSAHHVRRLHSGLQPRPPVEGGVRSPARPARGCAWSCSAS